MGFFDVVVVVVGLLGPNLRHVGVSRLGVRSEVLLPATTTATSNPSLVCNLHHSSQQRHSLNRLSEVRDRTCIFMDTNHVLNPLSHSGNSCIFFLRAIYTRIDNYGIIKRVQNTMPQKIFVSQNVPE